MKNQSLKIRSGEIQLEVSDSGQGDVALVFQHHWGGSSRTWDEVIVRVADRFRCVAIDARGAGGSEAPASGYSTRNHSADALNVIEALQLTRFVLVGHSMGGKSAQLLASQQPVGLAGLVLVASSPPSPIAIDENQRAQMRNAYANREAIEWSLTNVLVGSRISDSGWEQLVSDALRLSASARAGWVDIGTREDFVAEVAAIEVPVVIVAGDLDRVDPPAVVATHIFPHYPGADKHVLPAKGHLLPLEAPDQIAAIIRAFAD